MQVMQQVSTIVDDNQPTETDRIVTMGVCSLHDKKRQESFLVQLENGAWVCQEPNECKMATKPPGYSRENNVTQNEGDFSNDSVKDRRKAPPAVLALDHPPPNKLLDASFKNSAFDILTPLSADPSVMSWADEVDQEFPENSMMDDGYQCEYSGSSGQYGDQCQGEPTFHNPYESNYYPGNSAPRPRGRRVNNNAMPPRPGSFKNNRNTNPQRVSPRTSLQQTQAGIMEPEIISRVGQLEAELHTTKWELRKANEQVKAVMNNEKMLGLALEALRLEMSQLRETQLQLDLTGHDDRHRRMAAAHNAAAKLNPEATPFVPWAVPGEGPGMDSARHTDSTLNADSARSTVTSNFSSVTSARSNTTTLSVLEVEEVVSDDEHEHDDRHRDEHAQAGTPPEAI